MTETPTRPAPSPKTAGTIDPIVFWNPGGAPALAEESMDLWACGFAAWSDYLTRLTGAMTPEAWIDANTRLMADSMDLCTRAAALRLRHAGVTQPLLIDA